MIPGSNTIRATKLAIAENIHTPFIPMLFQIIPPAKAPVILPSPAQRKTSDIMVARLCGISSVHTDRKDTKQNSKKINAVFQEFMISRLDRDEDISQKEVALRLELPPQTVNDYIKIIRKIFDKLR